MRVRVGARAGGRGVRGVLGVPAALDIRCAVPAFGLVRRGVFAIASGGRFDDGLVAARGGWRVLLRRVRLLRAEEAPLHAFHLPSLGLGRKHLAVLGHRVVRYVSGCVRKRAGMTAPRSPQGYGVLRRKRPKGTQTAYEGDERITHGHRDKHRRNVRARLG